MSIKRPGDTRWSSHYGAIASLITMFSSVIDMVEDIVEDGLNSEQRAEANILIQSLQTFDFAFNLHLMKNVLGITNELSQILQRKDQDILNAMKLVEISKLRLQAIREDVCNSLFEEVSKFCAKNNIVVPKSISNKDFHFSYSKYHFFHFSYYFFITYSNRPSILTVCSN
jgi:hypothetical protein